MVEQKELKDMDLGELVKEIVNLRETFQSKLVSERDPVPIPEIYDKYGGVQGYNKMIKEEFEKEGQRLFAEFRRREELYLQK